MSQGTIYEYSIKGLYGDLWDLVATEYTMSEAKETLQLYRDNEPATIFQIVKKPITFSEMKV